MLQTRNTQIDDLKDVIKQMHYKINESVETEHLNNQYKDEINALRKQILINDLNNLKIKKEENIIKSADRNETARTNETYNHVKIDIDQ
jgi:hypothetical protein